MSDSIWPVLANKIVVDWTPNDTEFVVTAEVSSDVAPHLIERTLFFGHMARERCKQYCMMRYGYKLSD